MIMAVPEKIRRPIFYVCILAALLGVVGVIGSWFVR
jgi:hypothetical protein